MHVRDHRTVADGARLPLAAGPREPAILLLIEDVQRLVAQLRELRAPARSAAHGAVLGDDADDVDFLAVVDLIPERLQHFADRRRVGVPTTHQLRHVLEAYVAVLQLFVVEYAAAAMALDPVAVEREVPFLDAVPLGARAECRFGARRAAAEENRFARVHTRVAPWPAASSLPVPAW